MYIWEDGRTKQSSFKCESQKMEEQDNQSLNCKCRTDGRTRQSTFNCKSPMYGRTRHSKS